MNPMAYSDATKNTEAVVAPSFTMIGESVPEKFYEALDETMVSSGLLPRFCIIEYNGLRPPFNEAGSHVAPPESLIRAVKGLVAHVNHVNKANNNVVNVPYSTEARALLTDFDKFADAQINDASSEVTRHLWNRAHLKALKLAATVAVGIYPSNPVIDYACAKWATDLVASDIRNLLARFERGEVGLQINGHNDTKQHRDVIKFINTLVRLDSAEAERKYKVPASMHQLGVIPWKTLSIGNLQRAAFRTSRLGATNALKATIQFMIDSGELRELGTKDKERFNTNQRCFVVNDVSIIEKFDG